MSGLRGVRLNTFWGNHLQIFNGVPVLEQVDHIGKKTIACPDLYINQCEVKEVQDIETGKVELEDIFKDEIAMTDSTNEKYLRDIISSNGSNAKNIEARQNKGKGIVSQIITILEDICFGNF